MTVDLLVDFVFIVLLIIELTGGDGDKNEGGAEEEDPEVKSNYDQIPTAERCN